MSEEERKFLEIVDLKKGLEAGRPVRKAADLECVAGAVLAHKLVMRLKTAQEWRLV